MIGGECKTLPIFGIIKNNRSEMLREKTAIIISVVSVTIALLGLLFLLLEW